MQNSGTARSSKFMYYSYVVNASEKKFWPKNHTSKPLNELKINIFHYNSSIFELLFSVKFYPQGARISRCPKMIENNEKWPLKILAPLL